MIYTPRMAEPTLHRYLTAFPVIGLTGPRQSGKSTLLTHILPDYHYITFDDPQNILSFTSDPKSFLQQYAQKTIFDEVQYVPEIFNYIKIHVDQHRTNYGNFVLTGSSQFKFLEHATESLAGRIGLMSLLPFQYAEMPKAWVLESIFRGSYPELVLRNYHEADAWYASYVDTYLNKDIRALSNIGDMRDFRRFLQLLSANATQLLDMTLYAKDIGVSVPTIKRWLSILEASYIIFMVSPFYENHGKRITKSPKVYFYDTGLISYFTGIKTYEQYNNGPMAGALFENYIVSEIMKKELHLSTKSDLYYFRTASKVEIDLIIDHKSSRDFIEIKKSATFHPGMVKSLKEYADKDAKKILLYQGESYQYRDIIAMPYWKFLS